MKYNKTFTNHGIEFFQKIIARPKEDKNPPQNDNVSTEMLKKTLKIPTCLHVLAQFPYKMWLFSEKLVQLMYNWCTILYIVLEIFIFQTTFMSMNSQGLK